MPTTLPVSPLSFREFSAPGCAGNDPDYFGLHGRHPPVERVLTPPSPAARSPCLARSAGEGLRHG